MFATFVFPLFVAFPLFALIFMTVITIWTICDEWRMIRLLNEEYHIEQNWVIIIFASLSIIILWIFYWCSIIKWLC